MLQRSLCMTWSNLHDIRARGMIHLCWVIILLQVIIIVVYIKRRFQIVQLSICCYLLMLYLFLVKIYQIDYSKSQLNSKFEIKDILTLKMILVMNT